MSAELKRNSKKLPVKSTGWRARASFMNAPNQKRKKSILSLSKIKNKLNYKAAQALKENIPIPPGIVLILGL